MTLCEWDAHDAHSCSCPQAHLHPHLGPVCRIGTRHLLQVWLALHNLIVDPRCRAKYDLGDYRKDAILRLKRHMNEILFDQLPILKDLQRVLDEISLGLGAEDAEAQRSRLILEQVGAVHQ